jgi:mRNA-degrading endonuclease RelE of RelBE toxin-antitoxin system
VTLPVEIVYSRIYDAAFFALSTAIQDDIDAKTVWLAARLDVFPHERLQGASAFRLRVGQYRVIYTFSMNPPALHLIYVGHRREVYSKF